VEGRVCEQQKDDWRNKKKGDLSHKPALPGLNLSPGLAPCNAVAKFHNI
jgi:hypothetical protein